MLCSEVNAVSGMWYWKKFDRKEKKFDRKKFDRKENKSYNVVKQAYYRNMVGLKKIISLPDKGKFVFFLIQVKSLFSLSWILPWNQVLFKLKNPKYLLCKFHYLQCFNSCVKNFLPFVPFICCRLLYLISTLKFSLFVAAYSHL